MLATGWDSLFIQKGKFSEQMSGGEIAQAAVSGLQMLFIVLPVLGMGVTLSRVAKRTVVGFWNFTSGHPFRRVALGAAGVAVVAAAAFLLLPNGEYKPIQPGEDWTFSDSVDAASEVSTGRPGLTEETESELDARFFHETGEDPLASDDSSPDEPGSTTEEGATDPSTDDEAPAEEPVEEEEAVEPTPTPEQTTVTPEPTPTA